MKNALLQFLEYQNSYNECICIDSDNSNDTFLSSCWEVLHNVCKMHYLSFLFRYKRMFNSLKSAFEIKFKLERIKKKCCKWKNFEEQNFFGHINSGDYRHLQITYQKISNTVLYRYNTQFGPTNYFYNILF